MKKTAFTGVAFLSIFNLSAQEVVSTQGDYYSNASGSVSFTVGEVSIDTGSDGNNDITQGFQQTYWSFTGVEDHVPSFEVVVFPNPLEDVLIIESSVHKNVNYRMLDAQGKLISEGILREEKTSVDVSELAPGNYSLLLQNQQENLKTFKLIKHN